MQKKLNTKTIAFAAALIAMYIVLSRLAAINIGPYIRLTFSQIPLILAGFWFGPLVGGICGFTGDLLGALMQGYAPNVFINMTAILCGVLPVLMKRHLFQNKLTIGKLGIILAVNALVGSLGLTCLGLHIYFGTPYLVLYTTRPLQTVSVTVANTILVHMLYSSRLTAFVRESAQSAQRAR